MVETVVCTTVYRWGNSCMYNSLYRWREQLYVQQSVQVGEQLYVQQSVQVGEQLYVQQSVQVGGTVVCITVCTGGETVAQAAFSLSTGWTSGF